MNVYKKYSNINCKNILHTLQLCKIPSTIIPIDIILCNGENCKSYKGCSIKFISLNKNKIKNFKETLEYRHNVLFVSKN